MSQQHFATLLESIATITWRSDPEGVAYDLESWCAYSGRSVEDARGWGWLEDIHPADRERTSAVWTEATRTRSQYRVEYRIRNREGHYRWFDVHGTPLVDGGGEVTGWVGACIDIHDRVAAEERLRSVVDNMSEAFITIDRDFHITFQNQEGARINAKPPEAVLGKKMWEEWPEVLDSPLEWNYRAAMADGEPRRFEHRYYDPGKYDVWLEISAVPADDGGLGIFYLDISKRKEAEARLVESERRFRQLAENVRAVFLLTAAGEGEIVYASPFVRELFGVEPDEVLADPGLIVAAVHPEDRSEVAREIWNDPGGESLLEYRVTGAGGAGPERRVVHRRTSVAATEESGPRVAHILTDITDQRRLEAQLRQSQRMESLGRLAGGVAHDFNNVLTVILGRASLLYLRLEEEVEAGDWPEVREIEDAAARAANITRQILAFARDETGRPVDLDLNRALQKSGAFLRGLLPENVEVVALLEEDLPAVHIDPAQLDQVLVNLVANASDAMEGGGSLTVRTGRASLGREEARELGVEPGDYVSLVMEDTGTGIDPAIVDKIFDPFFSTRQRSGGTGLGLATCYGIVTRAGGAMTVASTPGEGASFRILLPAHPDAEVVPPEPGEQVDPRGTETILLVEDEGQLRAMVRDALVSLGYRVHDVASGEAALRHVEGGGEVDLVVTDVVMPGMSGVALARALRERRPELPVLTMSGYQAGETLVDSVVPPELAFLPKPFTPRTLARRIRLILDRLAT